MNAAGGVEQQGGDSASGSTSSTVNPTVNQKRQAEKDSPSDKRMRAVNSSSEIAPPADHDMEVEAAPKRI